MTLDDPKKDACTRTAKFRQYLAAFLVSLLGLCLGATIGWTSPMQPLLTSKNPPIGTEPMTQDMVAWLGSVNYFGSIVGTFFWGIAADRLGRKKTALLVAIPYFFGWLLILVAQNVAWLLFARFIAGIGASGTIVAIPFFISEMAQDDLRGFFGSFVSMFINLGIVYSYIVGAYLKYHGLAICGLVIPTAFLLGFIWVPETPIFLWKNGRQEKSVKSLLWYRGGDKIETERTIWKYKDMSDMTKELKKPSLKSLVATRGTRKALLIGIALWVSKQGSGIFPILSFAVSIFEMCGTSLTPYQAAIMMGTMQLVSGIFCSVLVERLGRKILLIGSLLIISLALGVLGTYLLFLPQQPVNPIVSWIPIGALCIHVVAFAVGIGPMAFIISAEIFPPEIRGLAMAKLQLLFSVLAFGTIKSFPTMKEYLKPQGCFWFYSACCIFFSIFFIVYLPETKGKPQNVILKLLNKEEINENDDIEKMEEMKQLKNENKISS